MTTVMLGTAAVSILLSAAEAPAKPEPVTISAERIAEEATITRGDLVLLTAPDPEAIKAPGPLAAFTPVTSADEMRIPFTVPRDDYYKIQGNNVASPQGDAYACYVDGIRTEGHVPCRWRQTLVRRVHWGHARMTPGEHVLALRHPSSSSHYPIAIADITLTPGRMRSFLVEAEWLSVAERDPETLRPAIGSRYLSGFGQLRLPAEKPGEAVTVKLPEAPQRPTHLVVALVGGPDRGIVNLAIDGDTVAEALDTYAEQEGQVTRVAVIPLDRRDRAPEALTVTSTGKHEKATGFGFGIDGVAFGQQGVFEAEWLVWGPDWGPTPLPVGTNSDRASDRGYVAGHARQADKPMTATLELPWTGRFRLQVRIPQSPDQGKLQFQFDQRRFDRVIDFHGQRRTWPTEWETLGTVDLTPGPHTFRIWWKDTDPKRRAVRLDAIRLVPVRD